MMKYFWMILKIKNKKRSMKCGLALIMKPTTQWAQSIKTLRIILFLNFTKNFHPSHCQFTFFSLIHQKTIKLPELCDFRRQNFFWRSTMSMPAFFLSFSNLKRNSTRQLDFWNVFNYIWLFCQIELVKMNAFSHLWKTIFQVSLLF